MRMFLYCALGGPAELLLRDTRGSATFWPTCEFVFITNRMLLSRNLIRILFCRPWNDIVVLVYIHIQARKGIIYFVVEYTSNFLFELIQAHQFCFSFGDNRLEKYIFLFSNIWVYSGLIIILLYIFVYFVCCLIIINLLCQLENLKLSAGRFFSFYLFVSLHINVKLKCAFSLIFRLKSGETEICGEIWVKQHTAGTKMKNCKKGTRGIQIS